MVARILVWVALRMARWTDRVVFVLSLALLRLPRRRGAPDRD
jgi:hypothetical protein